MYGLERKTEIIYTSPIYITLEGWGYSRQGFKRGFPNLAIILNNEEEGKEGEEEEELADWQTGRLFLYDIVQAKTDI